MTKIKIANPRGRLQIKNSESVKKFNKFAAKTLKLSYDYLNFADGRFGVVVGGVSGKGTSAALYIAQLKGMLQAGARHHRSLKDLVIEVNAIESPKDAMTLIVVKVDE